MSYSLVPPGKRGNATWLVRWTDADGKDREYSAGAFRDPGPRGKAAAKAAAPAIIATVNAGRVPGPGEAVTWDKAADFCIAAKRPAKDDEKRIDRLRPIIGSKLCHEIGQADIDAAAAQLYPTESNDTRNRQVYTPAISILNYAALDSNGWAPQRKWTRPKLKDPETRATADPVGPLLIANTTGKEQILVAWWFRHGTRITDSLRQRIDKIDMQGRAYEQFISKNRKWKTFDLDEEVWELLANDPDVQKGDGLLFPWKNRWTVYRWLFPLLERLGLRVYIDDKKAARGRRVVKSDMTPHMARHRLGKDLNAAGAGQRTIASALGQLKVASAARYTADDIAAVRAAKLKMPRLRRA